MWFAPLLPAAALLQELPPITGSILATEAGADGCSITGGVAVTGTLAATQAGADGCAITGTVAISGAIAAADGPADGCVITGSLGPAPIYVPAPLVLHSTTRGLSVSIAVRHAATTAADRVVSLRPPVRSCSFVSSARSS